MKEGIFKKLQSDTGRDLNELLFLEDFVIKKSYYLRTLVKG